MQSRFFNATFPFSVAFEIASFFSTVNLMEWTKNVFLEGFLGGTTKPNEVCPIALAYPNVVTLK